MLNAMEDLVGLCVRVSEQKLPRWDELPDLELYMDQVLSLMERYLGAYPGFGRKGLTASMVNNYVKLGLMPPPVKKKYTRTHLAQLLMICVLKASLSMEAIRGLLARSLAEADVADFFDRFCDGFESSMKSASDSARAELESRPTDALPPIYGAALRAQAEQTLARKLYEASFPQDTRE